MRKQSVLNGRPILLQIWRAFNLGFRVYYFGAHEADNYADQLRKKDARKQHLVLTEDLDV